MAKGRRSFHQWQVRFRQRFQERFLLRFHMFLITAAMLMSGVVLSKVMWLLGVRSLLFRYPIAVLASYAIFFVLLRIWLYYVSTQDSEESEHTDGNVVSISDAPDATDLLDSELVDAGVNVIGGGVRHGSQAVSKASKFELGDLKDGDGEGLVLILLLAVLVAIFGSSLYLIWEAPTLLTEVAVQMVLATSLRRATKQMSAPDWAGSVLGKTWIPFAIVFALTIIFALAASYYCPTATRMTDVIHSCGGS